MSRVARGRGEAKPAKPTPRRGAADHGARKQAEPPRAAPQETAPPEAEEDAGRIVERPDGFHSVDESGRSDFGPFATAEEAQRDFDGSAGRLEEDVEAWRIAEPDVEIDAPGEHEGDDPPEGAT